MTGFLVSRLADSDRSDFYGRYPVGLINAVFVQYSSGPISDIMVWDLEQERLSSTISTCSESSVSAMVNSLKYSNEASTFGISCF